MAIGNIFVGRVQMDNGGKYVWKAFTDLLRNRDISPKYTPPYYPESNGRAESLNRTLLDCVRSMVSPMGDSYRYLWAEVISKASHILNGMYSAGCQRSGM